MATVTKKSIALQQTIADELALRTGLVAVQGFDSTSGQPTIVLAAAGVLVATHRGCFIEISPVSWPLATDALGNAAIQYTPHRIQVVFEAISGAGQDPNGISGVDGVNDKLAILGCLTLRGTRVEWFESATGTAPSKAALIAADLVETFEPQPYYPMVSDQ